jgi:hypothetical protein
MGDRFVAFRRWLARDPIPPRGFVLRRYDPARRTRQLNGMNRGRRRLNAAKRWSIRKEGDTMITSSIPIPMKRGRKLGKPTLRCGCGRVAESGRAGRCAFCSPDWPQRREHFLVEPKGRRIGP